MKPRASPKPVSAIDFAAFPSPCYVLDEARLRRNMEILDQVQQQSGAKIICALKGYSLWASFDIIKQYLHGTTASGLYEAKLGHEEFGGEVHVYSPAFTEPDMQEILEIADHLSFNSFSQWQRFKPMVQNSSRKVSCGIRINPEYSEVETPLYDPCVPFSRLGVTKAEFKPELLEGLEGLHFHSLCGKGADTLERTIAVIERNFGEFLPRMKWVNFGGGHHITKAGYDVESLIAVVKRFREKWGVEVILEPGEAVGWQTGWLVSSVVDTLHNGMPIGILDISVSAHMPDCLEMPYRPEVLGAAEAGVLAHTYRLGGTTCLAGDVIGDYSFEKPLELGTRVVFDDMIHYTIVKTTMFNGVKHPSIGILRENGSFDVVREFGYSDFKARNS
ncbi:MAG: carboxynorspermidine decarboxylase [Deinococcales bacterium]